uniref:Uncharacterized protein n=1 Tax=Arundo donax TaxID=35708 RepID=A0A0A9DU52_ARUDO
MKPMDCSRERERSELH